MRTTSAKVIRPYSQVECRLIQREWYINAPLSPDLLMLQDGYQDGYSG
jgi:hypothetical protein